MLKITMSLHLSVESDVLPHWFYCILLCWTKKLAPHSLPIIFKTINYDLPLTFSRALGSVGFFQVEFRLAPCRKFPC